MGGIRIPSVESAGRKGYTRLTSMMRGAVPFAMSGWTRYAATRIARSVAKDQKHLTRCIF